MKRDMTKTEAIAFRIFATFLVFLGATLSAGLVWDTADMAQGLMVVTNIPSIAILGGVAVKCLDDYVRQSAEGRAPVFKGKSIGLTKDDIDCWQ